MSYRVLSAFIVFTFTFSAITPPRTATAQIAPTVLNLPIPGAMVTPTPAFTPALVKGLTIHPENPLQFDFIIDTGDTGLPIEGEAFRKESMKMIKYFLASLTVPEDELWVNLSPYEKDRVIPRGLGDTDMGRDMLALDYMLKQLTASLMYPEDELGQKFWRRVYKKAYEKYGSTQIPMNTFNKIWIVPDKAVVYEREGTVFVVQRHLKVMLEEDYLALQKNFGVEKYGLDSVTESDADIISGISSDVVREVLIPEIEREVNEGKMFAQLRQIYNSMILATWYKKNLSESLLGQLYMNKNRTKGVDVEDKEIKNKIYAQYVEAFKKGVYDYIREDYDPATKELIPRKYFSGGMKSNINKILKEMLPEEFDNSLSAQEAASEEVGTTARVGSDGYLIGPDANLGVGKAITEESIAASPIDDRDFNRYTLPENREFADGPTSGRGFRPGERVEYSDDGYALIELPSPLLHENSRPTGSIADPIISGEAIIFIIVSIIVFIIAPIYLVANFGDDHQSANEKKIKEILMNAQQFNANSNLVRLIWKKTKEGTQFEAFQAFQALQELYAAVPDPAILEKSLILRQLIKKSSLDKSAEILKHIAENPKNFNFLSEKEFNINDLEKWKNKLIEQPGLNIEESIRPPASDSEQPLTLREKIKELSSLLRKAGVKGMYRKSVVSLMFSSMSLEEIDDKFSSDKEVENFLEKMKNEKLNNLDEGVVLGLMNRDKFKRLINDETSLKFEQIDTILKELQFFKVSSPLEESAFEAADSSSAPTSSPVTATLETSQSKSARTMSIKSDTTGGINFNPDLLDLQIKRDGDGVPLPVWDQPIESMHIEGFIPVIINVTPVSLPVLLGLNVEGEEGGDPFDAADSESSVLPMDLGFMDKHRPHKKRSATITT